MALLLFKVENLIESKDRGLILILDTQREICTKPCSLSVLLKTPDGKYRRANAIFSRPSNAPTQPAVGDICEIEGVQKEDIPIGTEVWVEDDQLGSGEFSSVSLNLNLLLHAITEENIHSEYYSGKALGKELW